MLWQWVKEERVPHFNVSMDDGSSPHTNPAPREKYFGKKVEKVDLTEDPSAPN